jgi:thioredoxin-related protein
MNRIIFSKIFVITIFISFLYGILNAQEPKTEGINFFHGSFKEALDLAKKENKLVFMDAFTAWCGPCKRMSKDIFPNALVGEFYNSSFINIKVDMEKGEGPELSSKYGVSSYPTLLYLDGDGKAIFRTVGGRQVDAFIELGKEALKKYDRSGEYLKAYEAGARDPETILNLVKTLNQVGKPSLKYLNEYLNTQTDFSSKQNLEIISEGVSEADSKVFDLMIENKEEIIKLTGKDKFESKVNFACNRTFRKALEFRDESLLKDAQSKIKYAPTKQDLFIYNTDMEFYGTIGNDKKFLSAAKGYASKIAKSDASRLQELSVSCMRYFRDNKSVMKLAEELAKKAMQNGGLSSQYMNYVNILLMNNKNKEALGVAKQGLENAKTKNEPIQTFEQIIKKIEG